MKSFENALVISRDRNCVEAIERVYVDMANNSSIFHVETPSEGLDVLNKMGLSNGEIPMMIFLSVSKSDFASNGFLELLQRDYSDAARGKVVLMNTDFDMQETMKKVSNDCVFYFVNCPVMPIEIETILSLKTNVVVA